MRSRASSHTAALDRRLAVLADELTGVRPARPASPDPDEPGEPDLSGLSGLSGQSVGPDGPWWGEHTRVAAPRLPPAAAVRATPAAPAPVPRGPREVGSAPEPGRHVAARAVPLVRIGALGSLGLPQLAVVAVVVSLGVVLTGWWLVRGDPHPADDLRAAPAAGLVSPAAEPVAAAAAVVPSGASASPTGAASTTAGAASGPPGTVTVDVAGKVRHPGIAVLASGARVVDALEAAGGARPGIDLTSLNLARILTDGEQLLVGIDPPTGVAAAASTAVPGSTAGSTGTTAPTSGVAAGTLVDLNTATATDLDALPEVGPVTAASILSWRDQHGGFTSVDELLEVDGIGDATLAKLAPYVTV